MKTQQEEAWWLLVKIYLIVVLAVCLFLILKLYPVNAADQIDQSQHTSGTVATVDEYDIIFTPDHWNISAFMIYARVNTATATQSVQFDIYEDSTNELISTKFFAASSTPYWAVYPSASQTKFDFLSLTHYTAATSKRVHVTITDVSGNVAVISGDGTNLTFWNEYYDDEEDYYLPDETSYENYDYSLDQTSPDFATVNNQSCVIGDECRLWFSFNELAIGYPMYLTFYASTTIPENYIASTTLAASPLWQNYLVIPDHAAGTVKYNLLLDAADYGWVVKTGINVKWFTLDEWNDYMDSLFGDIQEEWCGETTVCADIATTSDFFYGVQCGFQKVICWTFNPTENSKKYILNGIESVENSFPFNLVFGFINKTATQIEEAEQDDNASLGVPMVSAAGEYYIMPVISTTSIPEMLGDSYDVLDTGTNYFIWILTAGLTIFTAWKIIL